MAGTQRKPDDVVREALAKEGFRFEFFQVAQLLQRLAPEAAPVGELGPAVNEAIRFVQDPSLIFHSSDVTSVRPRVLRAGTAFAEVECSFMGLFGAASPLASFVSEEVLRAEANDEKSLKAFYDIFHHRLYSLFYRAWKKYRFYSGFRTDGSDVFTRRALSFVGVDAAGAMPRGGLPATHLLTLAPLLAVRTRSARTLEIVLEKLLPETLVRVETFVLRRVRLEQDQRVLLGVQNTTLGTDFTIGRSVLDRSGRFRVVVGPVEYPVFEALMPGGRYHATLRKIIEQFSRGVLESELELRVKEDDSPRFQLGNARGCLLGATTHLTSKKRKGMRARVVLSDNTEEAKPQLIDDDAPPQSDRLVAAMGRVSLS
jgi:type VI secretion system protein ImpH